MIFNERGFCFPRLNVSSSCEDQGDRNQRVFHVKSGTHFAMMKKRHFLIGSGVFCWFVRVKVDRSGLKADRMLMTSRVKRRCLSDPVLLLDGLEVKTHEKAAGTELSLVPAGDLLKTVDAEGVEVFDLARRDAVNFFERIPFFGGEEVDGAELPIIPHVFAGQASLFLRWRRGGRSGALRGGAFGDGSILGLTVPRRRAFLSCFFLFFRRSRCLRGSLCNGFAFLEDLGAQTLVFLEKSVELVTESSPVVGTQKKTEQETAAEKDPREDAEGIEKKEERIHEGR